MSELKPVVFKERTDVGGIVENNPLVHTKNGTKRANPKYGPEGQPRDNNFDFRKSGNFKEIR